MVVCLKIDNSPGMQALDQVTAAIALMDNRRLPPGEIQWTCRAWVKEVLVVLHQRRLIRLVVSISEHSITRSSLLGGSAD